MRTHPSLSDVQRLLRARVCATCPLRTPGTDAQPSDFVRPCEASCPLFAHLPVLREAAVHLDPMVGHREQVLTRMVRRFTRHRPRGGRHGRRVVRVFEELFRE